MYVPDKKHRKIDPKSEKTIFVGYSLEQKGYKCFNPSTRQTRISRDVVFDEVASWYAPTTTCTEIEEPSGATNPSSEDEGWVSVALDIDNERSLSLEFIGPEPSNSYNTAQNEGETSCNRRSQWIQKKGQIPT